MTREAGVEPIYVRYPSRRVYLSIIVSTARRSNTVHSSRGRLIIKHREQQRTLYMYI